MAKSNVELQDLIERARMATLGRRKLLQRGAIGATAAAFATRGRFVAAQDSTPASPASGEVVQSITREEYNAKLQEVYPETADAAQGGTFILGDSSDISTTNGILINNSPTSDVMGLVFETLVNSDATEAGYVPGLADRWEISADGLTYTFYLNQNATWHDGTPFTADDVVFSFEAQTNPDTGSSYTGSFTDTVASWEKVDDHTLVVTAAAAIAPIVFFGNAYCPIMPKHLWEGVPLDRVGGGRRQHRSGSRQGHRHRTLQVRRVDPGRARRAREKRDVLRQGAEHRHLHLLGLARSNHRGRGSSRRGY